MTAARDWYRHVDAALVRASMSVADAAPGSWPTAGAGVEAWRAWIGQVWADRRVAEAVGVASPVLAGRVEAAIDGSLTDAARVRRLAVSLARYLVRMHGRATPFGLFAGVAAVRFDSPASGRSAGAQHVRAHADGVWLAGVVARLEACRPLLRRLRVVANNLIEVRGDRLWVRWQPHAGDPARPRPVEVSLRHTPPVALVLRAADAAVPVADLLGKLAAEYRRVPVEAVEAMLTELVSHGVLITDLRPPSTTVDALGHVLETLDAANAVDIGEVAALAGELHASHAGITADHQVQAGGRDAVVARMRELNPTAVQPLAVDLRLASVPVLPPSVAMEAAAAAEALLRLSPAPAGTPAWREYHARFLDRFGAGALVAITQLVDPVAGLGLPRHDAQSGGIDHAARPAVRDERLLALAQQAALDGVREVVLDDDTINAIVDGPHGASPPAPHLDVTVEVHAATTAALDAATFNLALTGVGRSGLATSGRFLELLSDRDGPWIGGLPTRVDAAMPAQVSFPPHHPRVENVTRVPQVLPAMIALAEHHEPAGDRIALADLAVTADLERLYLVSLSRRRVVEPVLACAAAWHTMPALARLLVELPHATSAPLTVFDWGTAACLPYRPRLRYRRTILAPACWRIPAGTLPGPAAGWAEWTGAVQRLRDRLRLPSWITVGARDRRLRLHLDDPMGLTLLRAHLDGAAEAVALTEAAEPDAYGWYDGRAHEVVIPLAATTPPLPVPAVLRREGPLPIVGAEHGYLPGSAVLSAKLYGPADAVDTVLTEHLPELLAAWDTPPVWWFLRYHDPAPQLRLRIRTDAYGRDAERVGAWVTGLRRAGLVGELTLDTYRPEIARYGAGAALAAVEDLFAADAAAAVAQLAVTVTGQAHPDALTAFSLVDLLTGLLGGRAAAARWLLEHPDPDGRAVASDRTVLRQTLAMADRASLAGIPGAERITAAWRARRQAAQAYASALPEAGLRPDAVAVSLLHLHHNRAHSADVDAEARTYKLARAVALAHDARRPTAKAARP